MLTKSIFNGIILLLKTFGRMKGYSEGSGFVLRVLQDTSFLVKINQEASFE